MKILHIGKYFPPFAGGIENFMATIIRQQAKSGHKVSAIVHSHDPDLPNKENWKGCDVHRVATFGQLAYAPIAPGFYNKLKQLGEAERPDVVHIHMPNTSAFWLLACNQFKAIPWIIHWHSDVVGTAPEWRIKLLYPFYRLFEQALLKRATKIIATSPNYLRSSTPLQPWVDKCVVVPLTTETSSNVKSHLSLRAFDEFDKRPLRLIMIGRLTYYKGHEYLLHALASIDQKVTLDIVGNGDLLHSLTATAAKLNLSDKVTFHGHIGNHELEAMLSKSDLLCLPSIERTEAFGLVLLEAAAASCPALVSDVEGSGMSFVVQHLQTGLVAKTRNVQSLTTQLNYACSNRARLKKMGIAARCRFEEQFSPPAVFQHINKLYDHAIKASTKR